MPASRPNKVLFFQHSSHNGGAPRSLRQIVTAYEREYGPQTVLFIRPGPVLKTYANIRSKIVCGRVLLPFHGSTVSGMSVSLALRNIFGALFVPGAYRRYLRGFDVVYFNSSALCLYGVVLRRFSPETRIIFHIREPLLDNIWGRIIRKAVRYSADYVFAISKNEMNNLAINDVPGGIVYNYVHSSEYSVGRGASLHRRDTTVSSDAIVVGYFARLDDKNGIYDFMEIAARFTDWENVVFCVYGYTGDEGEAIRRAVAGVGRNVRVYPMVANVPENLVDIDILVVPFHTPHFSRSVIEAAMLGVPSIIYDIASVNETVVDGVTGCVVPLCDVDAMASRVEQLIRDAGMRERLGAGAREFALEHFSERNYEKIRDIINSEDGAGGAHY